MCGHVGFMRGIGWMNASDFVMQGLWAGSLRGMDSTGIAAGSLSTERKVLDVQVYKKAMCGADFISLRRTYEILKDKPDWVIGHNRASTNGGIRDMHAHPFEEGHIVLAHNGHIHNQYNLPKMPSYADSRIDSARVAYSMAHSDELTTLEALRGGFALVWVNKDTNTLNFARNDAKPLYFAFEKGQNGIYWASESLMLEWLLDRNEVEYDEVLFPEPYRWYKFHPTDLRKYETVDFKKPSEIVITKTPAPVTTGWAELGQPNITKLGKKKEAKLLANHGLKIGGQLCVSLQSLVTRGGETQAIYNIMEKGLTKFKGAIQLGRPVDELRNQMLLKLEDRMELAYVMGVSGDRGKLWLIIDKQMDDSWKNLPGDDDEDDDDGPNYAIQNDYEYAPGPNNRVIPVQRFLELTAEGCAKCGKVLKPQDEIIWDEVTKDQYIVFCKGCGMNANVREG